ncbi:MAG: ABC transporter ATP-binding protein [Dehalococcoidales bacterium]|nr:ABC transporter ATP-binding protein [Dehalococcoidales bacterium]
MTTQTTVLSNQSPSKNNDVILRVTGLTKRFGALEAVKNLNLELRRGEVFGFLGPNGAGKSTTVGMILGLVTPTAGSIELFGKKLDGRSWPLLRRVGAIIEEPAFYPYMSGRDNLEVLSRAIGGIPKTKIDEVLKRVNLFERAKDRYGTYSMGMKQRLGIASTLLRDPELIILDEPTSGLDPAGTIEVRDLIPQLAHESRAVFLCSHLLHEVELVCNRVVIIKQGVMLVDSTVQELVTQGQRFQIKVENPAQAMALLQSVPWIKSVKYETVENGYLIVDAPKDSASRVNKILAENNIFASELFSHNVSLESVFLQLTGGNSGD